MLSENKNEPSKPDDPDDPWKPHETKTELSLKPEEPPEIPA